ncbi:MAG: DegT/DnrJ/EryC1/StrS family aminotransferase [Candidatus Omnitrophica bacterium CG07_land_8_20_14_0_80_42_15]|uniref:DegT/DnrJ/EryC1/StrS family aminotransferase n=1 Tax=Candidatus Aquitaenariimonas noxiae TaxID=1974741 RepID=A0A2J0L3H8_9BACT|nr:MAG: DegT/DnrJ/EryC1/StrS family aminotransferase [Candidatus Omnitrophica bacterium CG07_land_8_20_14_0_80_42_15]
MKIPITKPVFDDCEKKAVLKPLETGWLVQGPFVAEFEKLFARYVGAQFAKATTSCTTALHLALEALGIKKSDKVVVPSFTYIASANAIEYANAEVVFCDIDLRTFNIDVEKLESIIQLDKKRKIKAIMPVNLFGLCADLPAIMQLAKKYGIKIVEDSACGLGAFIGKKHSGTFGDMGCFSFHPRKAITTGEGGMVITDDNNLTNLVASLRDHGASKSDLQRHKEKDGSLLPEFNLRGYNYRMTDIQGAIGVCQIKKAATIIEGRRLIARRYSAALSGIPFLILPYLPLGYTHGYQSYVCLFTAGEDLSRLTMHKIDRINKARNNFMMKLERRGISVRQGTHAVHTLGYYKNKYTLKDKDYLSSYAADRLSVTLPLYADMNDKEFNYVIENIKEILK